jgi:hypothetical protein
MQSSTITPPASHARGRHLLDGSLPPVGEQQEHIGPQHPHGGYPHDVVYPGDYYRERDRAGSGYPVDPVVVHHTGEHPQETVRQEDPTNGIPWTPGGDQSAYQREDQEEYPSQQTRPTIALRMAAAEPGRERDKFSAGSPRLERRSRPRRPSLGWSRARLQRWAWFGGGRSSRFTWRPRRRCVAGSSGSCCSASPLTKRGCRVGCASCHSRWSPWCRQACCCRPSRRWGCRW